MRSDEALKAATAFGGGIGGMGSACGALIGGSMALSLLYGRSYDDMLKGKQSGKEKEQETLRILTKKLGERFEQEYGSFLCNDIEKKIFGRSFNKWNPAEREVKEAMGGHKDK